MRNIISMALFSIFSSLALCHAQTQVIHTDDYKGKIRVACIGNSITYGYGIRNKQENSYPAQLQRMLGPMFDVRNFGHNGATLLSKGHRPYRNLPEFDSALVFRPHVVIIHLGLNDTDPRDWPLYGDDFIQDYESLIDAFVSINTSPKPKIWICKMTPIFSWHPRFKTGTREYFWAIQKAITEVARKKQVSLIDLYMPLYGRPDLYNQDALHPKKAGATIIAETVKKYITGDFGGLSLPAMFTDHMVVQRGKPVHIYGNANTGEKVDIDFAGIHKQTVAGIHGKWSVFFPEMTAGGPYVLRVSADKNIEIKDIMIGEVWLCSGQSNMAFELKKAASSNTEIPKANYPQIRLFGFKSVAWPGAGTFTQEQLDKINRNEYFKKGPWQICTPETASDFSAVGYFFGKELHNKLGVPIGLINNAVGGSNTESWIDRKTLEGDPETVDMLHDWLHNDLVQKWCRQRAALNLKYATNPNQQHPFEPSYLFVNGIQPLISFPFRGVIWYQGESNADCVYQHEVLFKMLVNNWRESFNDSVMPFYYVQLSGLNRPSWPAFRNSQRKLLYEIPHTGMAVTSDIGDSTNVHPKNKKDVGHRLALWALTKTYHKKLVFSGPLFRNIRKREHKIIIFFDYIGSGLTTSDHKPLRGFEIAGAEGYFVSANVKLKKKKVIVFNPAIQVPELVRYAWQSYPEANLVNKEGLPASTFTTEMEAGDEREMEKK